MNDDRREHCYVVRFTDGTRATLVCRPLDLPSRVKQEARIVDLIIDETAVEQVSRSREASRG